MLSGHNRWWERLVKWFRGGLIPASLAILISLYVVTLFSGTAKAELRYRGTDVAPELSRSATPYILTLNVAHGRGTALNQVLVRGPAHRRNLEDISTIVLASGADVVALQEADAPSLWSGSFDHVEYLAQATGLRHSIHGYHADAWPFTYGAALMSRLKISDARSHRFRPSWPTAGKGFVLGSVLWQRPGQPTGPRPVTLVSVHLDFSRESVRRAQIAELVAELKDVNTPLVLMGDFNADWPSEDSPLRELAVGLDLRAFMPMSRDLGTYQGSKRLDWILISNELTFIEYSVVPDVVSDHLAVVAKLGWLDQD